MTLGELRDILRRQADAFPGSRVEFSDGTVPGALASWRGCFAEATLTPLQPSALSLVEGVLAECDRALGGAVFEGYKGGDFTFNYETPVWADEYGSYTSHMIFGVVSHPCSPVLVLDRRQLPEEYQ